MKHLSTVHVRLDRADHQLSERCACMPVQTVDLAEPSRIVVIHGLHVRRSQIHHEPPVQPEEAVQ